MNILYREEQDLGALALSRWENVLQGLPLLLVLEQILVDENFALIFLLLSKEANGLHLLLILHVCFELVEFF